MYDAPTFAPGEIVGGGDVRGVTYGNDKGLYVEFRSEPIYQEFASQQGGKAIYKDEVFVRIYTPGDKTKVVDRLAKLQDYGDIPSDARRWPIQWAAFKNGAKAMLEGTPLAKWPAITAQQVQEFNAFNIYTVDQLAEVSDGALDGLGHGGRAIRDGAIEWLKRANDDGAFAKLQREHQAQMEAMQAQIVELQATQKRGPGRPPKEETE